MNQDQKTPDSSLKTRIRSALVLAPVVLVILWFGGFGFTLMMAAACAIGIHEWSRMVLSQEQAKAKGIEYLAGAAGALAVLVTGMVYSAVVSLWLLLAMCFLVFAYNFSQGGGSLRRLLLGVIYIGFSVSVMVWLRNGTVDGLYHTMTLLLIVWASDSFAYFSGRAIGGPKLAPTISPKKTWAGFWGSSLGAGLVAGGMACPWLVDILGVTPLGGMSFIGYFVMGFILAMFGQVGDLFISLIKRHYGVKDTGNIIPGHGGILDRIDALLLVALVFGAVAAATGIQG